MKSKDNELLFLSFNQEASYVTLFCVSTRCGRTGDVEQPLSFRLRSSGRLCLRNNATEPTTLSLPFVRCISVGTRQGFAIYNCEPFGKCFQEQIGGIGIAEMLYCTSLVALVGAGEQVPSQPLCACFALDSELTRVHAIACVLSATPARVEHQDRGCDLRSELCHGGAGSAHE